jgi:hypothetical protein
LALGALSLHNYHATDIKETVNEGSSFLIWPCFGTPEAGSQSKCKKRWLTKYPACIIVSPRTRTNTNPNGTEANTAGRSGNARALRKQSKCEMIQEGEGHWPKSSKKLQKARNLWVLRTPQNNKEEGARAKKLVTCGTRGPLGRGQSVPFSAQGAYCSAPEP